MAEFVTLHHFRFDATENFRRHANVSLAGAVCDGCSLRGHNAPRGARPVHAEDAAPAGDGGPAPRGQRSLALREEGEVAREAWADSAELTSGCLMQVAPAQREETVDPVDRGRKEEVFDSAQRRHGPTKRHEGCHKAAHLVDPAVCESEHAE